MYNVKIIRTSKNIVDVSVCKHSPFKTKADAKAHIKFLKTLTIFTRSKRTYKVEEVSK